MRDYKWINESSVRMEDGKIIMAAPPKSDFFCGGNTTSKEGALPSNVCNAPFYYTEATGDFVLRAKVSLEFRDTFDSATLMVMKDMENWAKACFELTDFGTHAAVSVVTKNGSSDDANGCNIEGQGFVWLQICRVGDAFAFHYSLDGRIFYMMRYFLFPAGRTVKVGMVAQAPTGQGGDRVFECLSLENRTVNNIRAGK